VGTCSTCSISSTLLGTSLNGRDISTVLQAKATLTVRTFVSLTEFCWFPRRFWVLYTELCAWFERTFLRDLGTNKIHHTAWKSNRLPSFSCPNLLSYAPNIGSVANMLRQRRRCRYHDTYVQCVRLPAPRLQSPGGDQFPIHYCCFVKQNGAVLLRANSNTKCARTTVRLPVTFKSAQLIKYYFQQSRQQQFKLYTVSSAAQNTHSVTNKCSLQFYNKILTPGFIML